MDEQKSTITVVGYLLIAIVAGVVSYGSFRYYRGGRTMRELADEMSDIEKEGRRGFGRGNGIGRLTSGRVAPERYDRLQELLDRTSTLLEIRDRELDAKTREYEEMQADLNSALDLLMTMVTGNSDKEGKEGVASKTIGEKASKGSDAGEKIKDMDRNEVEVEVKRLRLRLEMYDRELLQQTMELEDLRRDFATLNQDMLEDRIVGQPRIATELNVGDQDFEEAMMASFALIGEPAVPVLEHLLDHRRSDIRRLAATTIGALGEAGRDGEDSLRAALNDSDPRVVAAAKDSLQRLSKLSRESK